MSLADRIPSVIKLLAVLIIVTAATFVVACGGDDATTTTAGVSTTASAGGTATSAGSGTVTTTGGATATTAAGGTGTSATSTGQSTQTTQVSSSGGLPSTPPSTVGGESSPPQPGADYVAKLPGLEQTVQDKPKDLDALAQLAVAYYQTQAFAKAEETYKKMISLDDQAQFHNNLANVYRDWVKVDQAVSEYRAAIAIDPKKALWYGNLAAMYMMGGNIDKAREVTQDGIEKTSGEERAQLEKLLASFS